MRFLDNTSITIGNYGVNCRVVLIR